MLRAKGCIEEISLDPRQAARISCPPGLAPRPGQYLLATLPGDTASPLAQVIFPAGAAPGGFFAAERLPAAWQPGSEIDLRGPFGKGFTLPPGARRVALGCFEPNCARVLALLEPALRQGAEVCVLSDTPPAGLPSRVEILPLEALTETARWAHFLALEIRREALMARLAPLAAQISAWHAQVLVSTPVPCAGMAECGVCAVRTRKDRYRLACKDGPVFELEMLDLRG